MLYEKRDLPFELWDIKVREASDDELMIISDERQLALSLDEMKRVQEFFQGLDRDPTDLEMEAIAQAWSEHCCYKSSWNVLKGNLFTIEAPQNLVVINADAAVIDFDEDYAYVVALESHNHPSALEPVGGAETGIGGILRDVVCMGGQPIALVDPLFFGPLDFPEEQVPEGTKHPTFIYRGVVQGIRDYGNRVGIPTVAGCVKYHEGYVTNCLVNVGCVGLADKNKIIPSHANAVGEILVMAGGRTGRDGIHGVSSLASQELSAEREGSARTAVQMGDAITKEPLIHATLEAIDKRLVSGCKDFGGGGLSSCAGEIAHGGGFGLRVQLDKLKLKVKGMAPWEIWVSESQERMLFSIKPELVEEVLAIFKFWDVEAVVIGEITDTGRAELFFEGVQVADLDLDFYSGAVRYNRPYVTREWQTQAQQYEKPEDLGQTLLALMAQPNIASQEWVIRQYDHEVRGKTVLKPLQGAITRPGPGDASLIKPRSDTFKGLALTSDVNPFITSQDPYWGGASAVEESFRNLVATGARPHSFCDNLCFGNPEKPDRMGDFVRATDGMFLVADALKVPCVSGNVSLYNEGVLGSIPPTPVIMAVGLIDDLRKAVTSDLKRAGSALYLVGETADELAGSAFLGLVGGQGAEVPKCDPASFTAKMEGLLAAIDQGLVLACHDLAEGGLGVAIAEMAIGGEVGAKLDLAQAPGPDLPPEVRLFSESNGRWLVEVAEERATAFEQALAGTATARVGTTTDSQRLVVNAGELVVVDVAVSELAAAWTSFVPGYMGL